MAQTVTSEDLPSKLTMRIMRWKKDKAGLNWLDAGGHAVRSTGAWFPALEWSDAMLLLGTLIEEETHSATIYTPMAFTDEGLASMSREYSVSVYHLNEDGGHDDHKWGYAKASTGPEAICLALAKSFNIK